MKLEEIQQNSYEFIFEGGINNIHSFVTDNKISYEIKFKESNYVFIEKFNFPYSAFEFVIDLVYLPVGIKPTLDPKIPFTIAAIFVDFFKKNNENIVIYICDSSDNRQNSRRRKFNQWLQLFKEIDIVTAETEIIDKDGTIYYNTIIVKADNSRRNDIVTAFLDIATDNQK
jgi:Family of unknown function (DUF6169)